MTTPLWHYIKAREEIRLARVAGQSWPWTTDPILSRYKFTNVKRLHDRTTQAFLATYTEHEDADAPVALYNCAVRRFFGTAEFGASIGWRTSHSADALREAVASCSRPWTGAYIICAGAAGVPKVEVVAEQMGRLWERARAITMEIWVTNTWQAGYNVMHTLPGFGGSGFMAKEVLQDYILWLHVAGVTLADEQTWTPIGPGGRRGLNRLAGRPVEAAGKFTAMLAEICALRETIAPLWKQTFPDAEDLTAHDIQFCLCEFDKYERVRLGEGKPRSLYKPPAVR